MDAQIGHRLHRSFTVHPHRRWTTPPQTAGVKINDVGGLPAHPLIVHIPVVLVPLATIGAILMLIRPSWRRMFEIPTAVLAVTAAIATQLALESGEALESQVAHSDLIETHSNIAEQARPWIFLFAAVMLAVAVWDLVQRRGATGTVDAADATGASARSAATSTVGTLAATAAETAVVAQQPGLRTRASTVALVLTSIGLVLGIGSTVQVYRTGHSGAKATWHDVTEGSRPDGDGDAGG